MCGWNLFSSLSLSVELEAVFCFDEFNRITIEVLSVVAQQILSILQAQASERTRFVFEGREINITSTCGIFITMVPGQSNIL